MRLNLIRGRFVVLIAVMLAGVGMAAEPIGFWRFNGDLTDSAGGADGVFNGGIPVFVAGVAGQAVAFDGVDDLVDVMIGNMDAYTISAWVKPARLGAASIVARTSASGTTVHWSHQVRITAGNVFEHYTYDGAAKSVIGTTQIEVDTWYHVGITASNNGDIRLYVNGQEEGTAAAAGALWTGGDRYAIGSNSGNAMGWFLGPIDDVRIYDTVLPQQEIMPALNTASGPRPGDAAVDVLRDSALTWKPSEDAARHNLYFGLSFEDVNTATGPTAADLDANSFDPGRLDFGQTYFWRVDEVNSAPDKTVFKGEVWSFTAEPYSILIPGSDIIVTASSFSNEFSMPEKSIDGSGLGSDGAHAIDPEAMWFTASVDLDPWIQYEFDDVRQLDVMKVWNSNSSAEIAIGWGIKDVQIEYSVDGETWEVLAGATQFSRAPGSPAYDQYDEIDFGGVPVKYVRLDIVSNWGGILMSYSLSEVQFNMIPAQARTPVPAAGSVGVIPTSVVTWRSGRAADQHTIYVSTDANAVADGLAPSVSSSINSVDLTSLDLQLDETYYWRVDEVNEAEATPVWAGPVWSFSTVEASAVDDFESYTNVSPDRPFQTWLDGFGYSADEFFPAGYGGNGTGAGIGHDIWSLSSPYYDGLLMETVIVMPGSSQSMPFYYSNTGGVASETQVKFAGPQNWAANGIKTLAINIFGAAGNSGQLYIKINNIKLVATSDVDIQKGGWQLWPIDLSTVAGNIEAVTSLTIGVEGASASGLLYVDDIRLYARDAEYVTPSEPDSAKLLAYYNFDGNANDSSGNGLNGEEIGAPTYTDGKAGQAIQLNGFDDYVNVVVDIPENGATVAFWFNTADPDCGLFSVVQNLLGGGGIDRNIYLTEGHVGVRLWNEEIIVGAGLDVADGQWHHLGYTYGDAVGGQHLYIDGLLQASGIKAQSDFDWQERIHIGWTSDAVNPFMDGMMDDARIYNSTLSAAEIAWLYGRTEPLVKPF